MAYLNIPKQSKLKSAESCRLEKNALIYETLCLPFGTVDVGIRLISREWLHFYWKFECSRRRLGFPEEVRLVQSSPGDESLRLVLQVEW